MRATAAGLIVLLAVGTASAPAHAIKYTRTVGATVQSSYIFRGVQRAEESIVLDAELQLNGYYLGAKGVLPFGDRTEEIPSEGRFYLGWTPHVPGPAELDFGASLYTYPEGSAVLADEDRVELYGGLFADLPLHPAIYARYDFEFETTSIEGGFRKFVGLPDLYGVEFGFDAGWVGRNGFDEYRYLTGSIDLVRNFSYGVEAFIGLRASAANEDVIFSDVEQSGPVYGDKARGWVAAGVSATF